MFREWLRRKKTASLPRDALCVLYYQGCDQGLFLDTPVGLGAVGFHPCDTPGKGNRGVMQVCLHLWLLHAWRNVPHDGEGRHNADGTTVEECLRRRPNPAGRCLFLFGVAAGDIIDVGFTRRHVIQPAGIETLLCATLLLQPWYQKFCLSARC
jgi:hypothetical protein